MNRIPSGQKPSLWVALVDPDESYRQEICRYYERQKRLIEVVKTASSLEELKIFLELNEVHVVIVNRVLLNNPDAELSEMIQQGVLKIMIVTETLHDLHNLQFHQAQPSFEWIYKYSPMSIYTQRITSLHPNQTGKFNQVAQTFTEPDRRIGLFYSPKGGVGKTTLAVNTACQLARKDKRTLLVDFSVFGHTEAALGLPYRTKGLSEAIRMLELAVSDAGVDSGWNGELHDILCKSIQTIELQGKKLDVLTAAAPFKMSGLTIDQTDLLVRQILNMQYEVVIVDTSIELSDKNISLLNWATDLFYITTPDVSANLSILSVLDIVQSFPNDLQNRYLLMNRHTPASHFPVGELESVLGMPVAETIPETPDPIQYCANQGILLAEKAHLPIQSYFRRIAHLLAPVFSQKELSLKRSGWKGVLQRGS
ncbi:AAA family ATPase [Effusibacillus dendaii]|uniref:CobQ/CobB/MinD/ParA nucleotide binding domain-containing protein n=1 Tax=Effusibacillus dendaii TaxID=2743772 RepID=A0A7I8DB95_9BACL|nr:AAA family ATPase [Effusibacillus dendaii]BCJ86622.1 hypothetical protein skT53_16070 [Effusibacillus dendaii]